MYKSVAPIKLKKQIMTGHLHSGLRLVIVAGCMLIGVIGVSAQKRGTITGKVTPAADVIVIATNQVTSKVTRARAGADGQYSISVRPGAYRLSVALSWRKIR